MAGVADVIRYELLLLVEVQPCGLQLVRAWPAFVQSSELAKPCERLVAGALRIADGAHSGHPVYDHSPSVGEGDQLRRVDHLVITYGGVDRVALPRDSLRTLRGCGCHAGRIKSCGHVRPAMRR
jgi:hypothetical protein